MTKSADLAKFIGNNEQNMKLLATVDATPGTSTYEFTMD